MSEISKLVWAELLYQLYPEIPIIQDDELWMNGHVNPPVILLETDIVSEKMHTSQSARIIEDVGLIFRFKKIEDPSVGQPYVKIDVEMLRSYLRKHRYCIASKAHKTMLVLQEPSIQSFKDRIEFECRYSYLLSTNIELPGEKKPEKINHFYVEVNGEEVEA
ncbi:hypothetical protein P4S93_18040 [Aneurinibacillus thermoaerophilus]|uniref:Uncharacterized protein n=1 Tax=Aneurinibacillus thermoaerophilus TaxID=143495 RepID=A0A1G8ETM4_ANETH|nr:hypothetical protein [Aneurinibacillus thermoaerophilus]MED0757409.1 hypothetical protein [Aneurinibacillus thermoaerophilus]MED0762621.1 hypothetical protein [Aneurinibacillus thermoaerophilus]SDH73079.1 hypothetical protein SAMN04489735_104815 [Aneurinibacillus thermoaerophilus]